MITCADLSVTVLTIMSPVYENMQMHILYVNYRLTEATRIQMHILEKQKRMGTISIGLTLL